jgi:S-DNA-T family DNA segregation ATPase FtsK/SpoIIIE
LKVQGQVENDMVLGTSAYKNGTRATMFSRKDRGIALLSGEGDDPVIVRASYVDTPTAANIAARARTARLGAGLLTGHAAGLDPDLDTDTASILDHLSSIWPAAEDKTWCDDLAARLAVTYPGTYDGWTGEQVTAAVKPHGLNAIQIKRTIDGRQVNRRGLARTDLTAALADRDDTQDPF